MPRRTSLGPLQILGASLLTALLLAAAGAGPARADQFVLFDVTFDYTKMQADTSTPSKSHFYVKGNLINPARPTNWVAPVDYRNGTVHIRTEVIEKPAGGERTEWTLCYIPNRGQGNGYGCTGSGIYTEKGLYERDVPMTSWWENQSIIWTDGIKQMDLVIKDGSGGNGHAHNRPDHEKFFPTKMRITMVQVSAGAKYDPSKVPNLSPAPPDAGAPADAATGGTGGQGSAGTGGTGGGQGNATGGGPGPAPGPEPAPPAATPPSTPTPAPAAPAAPARPAPAAAPTTPAPVSGGGCSMAGGEVCVVGCLLPVVVGALVAIGRRRRKRR